MVRVFGGISSLHKHKYMPVNTVLNGLTTCAPADESSVMIPFFARSGVSKPICSKSTGSSRFKRALQFTGTE